IRVEHVAFTANNVTYGLLGERLGYWRFFPAAPTADAAGWGRIPAWGVGEVTTSLHPDVPVAERIFGYLPIASHAVLQPAAVRRTHFADGSPHRAELDPTYNNYQRLTADPAYDRAWDGHLALLRPQLMTALV